MTLSNNGLDSYSAHHNEHKRRWAWFCADVPRSPGRPGGRTRLHTRPRTGTPNETINFRPPSRLRSDIARSGWHAPKLESALDDLEDWPHATVERLSEATYQELGPDVRDPDRPNHEGCPQDRNSATNSQSGPSWRSAKERTVPCPRHIKGQTADNRGPVVEMAGRRVQPPVLSRYRSHRYEAGTISTHRQGMPCFRWPWPRVSCHYCQPRWPGLVHRLPLGIEALTLWAYCGSCLMALRTCP